MARPSQLVLIGIVYVLGVTMAYAHGYAAESRSLVVGLLALVPVAASVHYANEYADYETDALTTRTRFSGGSGALVDSGLPRRLALNAAVAAGTIGLGLLLAWSHALPRTAAGLLLVILLVGWQYSVGPLRLAWRGFGEVTNAALGGVVLSLYGYAVVAGNVTTDATLATIPFALVVYVSVLETAWPDRRADAAVGKRTLATRWSRTRLRALYVLASAFAVSSVVVLAGIALPSTVAVVTLVPMVGLVWGSVRFTRRETLLPAVMTMVLVAIAMTGGWLHVATIGP